MLYISIFGLLLITSFLSLTEINKKIIISTFIIITGFLVFLSAFRYHTGVDWPNYIYIFNSIFEGKRTDVEIGFYCINKIFGVTFNSFYVLQVFISVFCGVIIYKYIYDYSKYPIATVFLYYVTYFFTVDMAQTRQWIAMALIVLGVKQLFKQKTMQFFIFISIAMTFHISSIVVLPFIFMRKKYSDKFYKFCLYFFIFLFFLGGLFLYPFFSIFKSIPFITGRLAHLLNSYVQLSLVKKITIPSLIKVITHFYIGLLSIKNIRNEKDVFFLNNFIVYCLFYAVAQTLPILERIGMFYCVSGGGIFVFNSLFEKNGLIIKKMGLLRYLRIIFLLLYITYPFITFTSGYNPQKLLFQNFNNWNPYKSFIFLNFNY